MCAAFSAPMSVYQRDFHGTKRPPTACQVAHWITFKEDRRLEWQKTCLSQLCQADVQMAQTSELIQEFTTMLRERQGEKLDAWLQKVEDQGVSELQSFAQGLRRDYDAVKAGLTLVWSQGQVEGQVHRSGEAIQILLAHIPSMYLIRFGLLFTFIDLSIALMKSQIDKDNSFDVPNTADPFLEFVDMFALTSSYRFGRWSRFFPTLVHIFFHYDKKKLPSCSPFFTLHPAIVAFDGEKAAGSGSLPGCIPVIKCFSHWSSWFVSGDEMCPVFCPLRLETEQSQRATLSSEWVTREQQTENVANISCPWEKIVSRKDCTSHGSFYALENERSAS